MRKQTSPNRLRYSSKKVDPLLQLILEDPEQEKLTSRNAELFRSENNGSRITRIKLPSINQFRASQNREAIHVVPRQSIDRINNYKTKMFEPHSCSRSHRLHFIRAYRLMDNARPQYVSPQDKHSKSKSHGHLSTSESTIETVPLSFLVYQNFDHEQSQPNLLKL